MIFTLSIQAMLRQLYARGAMAWSGGARTDNRPEILRKGHEQALRELLKGSFARLCIDLFPLVVSTNLDECDPATDPFFIIELDLPPGIDPSALRVAMELAIALRALTGSLTGIESDEAAAISRETTRALTYIRSIAVIRSAATPSIVPTWH